MRKRTSKIFEVSNDIPETHMVRKKAKGHVDQETLRNHLNHGDHTGKMDDVKRANHPDAHEIETDILGEDE